MVGCGCRQSLNGVQGVAGSNPAVPIKQTKGRHSPTVSAFGLLRSRCYVRTTFRARNPSANLWSTLRYPCGVAPPAAT
jgi:hypothetical protein